MEHISAVILHILIWKYWVLRIKPTQKYINHIVSKHVTKDIKNLKIIIRIIPVTRDIDPVPAHFEYVLYAKTIQLKHDQTFSLISCKVCWMATSFYKERETRCIQRGRKALPHSYFIVTSFERTMKYCIKQHSHNNIHK